MKVLFMALVVWSGICLAQSSSQPVDGKVAEIARRLAAVRHTDFVLEGMVVDDQGKAIDDVGISVLESRQPKTRGGADHTTRSQKVNGVFAVEVTNAESVDLRFYREGVFGERIEFDFSDGLPKNWQQRVIMGEALVPDVVKRKELRVVMERHGKLAELTRVVDRITCPASGPAMVWDLSTIDYNPAKKLPDSRNVAALPDNCIYLDVPLDSVGHLALETINLGGNDQPRPKSLRIVLKGDGGFVPVPTTQKTSAMQYRRMTEAPEKGYHNELVLDEESVKRYFQSLDKHVQEGAYFYFRAGKLYGKGELKIAFPTNKEVTVSLVLRFQNDGTRNVATED